MRNLLPLALAASLLPAAACAQQAAGTPAPASGWKGQGELGLAISRGNTDSQTLVGKLNAAHEGALWKNAFNAAFLYGKSDDVESARRYEVSVTTGRRLGAKSYLFGSLRHERDHFATYEYQWSGAAGYGYEAIRNQATHLTFEIGSGYRWSKLQGVRVHEDEAIARGYLDFGHKLGATTSFYDTLLVEAGADNTFARNDLGIQVAMTAALALKAGLETRHNTDALPGVKNTDTLTTVNVVYGF